MYTATLHQTHLPRYEIHGHQTAKYSYITGLHGTQTLQSWINTAHLGNRMTDNRPQQGRQKGFGIGPARDGDE